VSPPDAPPPPWEGADGDYSAGSSAPLQDRRRDTVEACTRRFEALADVHRASAGAVRTVTFLVDSAAAWWTEEYGFEPDDDEWGLVEGMVVRLLEAGTPARPRPAVATDDEIAALNLVDLAELPQRRAVAA
jgi:hypothetical protein